MQDKFKATPKLVLISGPSGAGKDTVIAQWLKKSNEFAFLATHTSRKPRPQEQDGVHYTFIKRNEFAKMIEHNELFEWSEVYGNYYGVNTKPILRTLLSGKNPVIRVDFQGVRKIQTILPQVLTVPILPTTINDAVARIKSRGSIEAKDLATRIQAMSSEIKALYQLKNRHLVFNYDGDIDAAVNDLELAILQNDNFLTQDAHQKRYDSTIKALKGDNINVAH